MLKYIKKILRVFLINKSNYGLIISGPAKGFKMFDPKMSYLTGTYEPNLIKAIKTHVKPGDIVFDIGANMGYITLVLSRYVGMTGKVLSFEPISSTFNRLELNVKINELNNVMPFNLAVSDINGSAIFRMIEGHDSMASMNWHLNKKDALVFNVDCISIDNDARFQNLKPSFIKIDVEGAETEVVRGMLKLIKRERPVIYTEVSELGRTFIWNSLISLDYSCYSSKGKIKIQNIQYYKHDDFIWISN